MHEGVAFSLATNVGQAEYAFSLISNYTVFVKIYTKVTLAFLASVFVSVIHLFALLCPKRFPSFVFSNFNISSIMFTTLAPIRGMR